MTPRRIAAFVMPYLGDSDESERFLRISVESIFEQSDKDWILVIVDDCSEYPLHHGVLGPCAEIHRHRLILLRTSSRMGPGVCRNIGVQVAYDYDCPFVLFLDADDVATPRRLEWTREALQDVGVDVVYSSFTLIDANERNIPPSELTPSIASILHVLETAPPEGPDAWIEMATNAGYSNLTSTTAVRMRFALNVPFPQEMVSEDFHTWLRLGASGASFRYLRTQLCKYRIAKVLSGSSSRLRFGPSFYKKKAQIDSRGVEEAITLAQRRGALTPDKVPVLREAFRKRLAAVIRSEGEVELAAEFECLPSSDPSFTFLDRLDVEQVRNSGLCLKAEAALASSSTLENCLVSAISMRCHAHDRHSNLLSMLNFANREVPFYRDQWRAGGLPAFDALPYVRRNDVSLRMLDLCADDLASRKVFRHRTSGTTGEPITGLMDYHDWQMNLASIVSQLSRLGLKVDREGHGPWSFMQVTVYPEGRSVQIETDLPNQPVWRRLNIPGRVDERNAQLQALGLMVAVLEDAPCVLNGMPSALLRVAALLQRYFAGVRTQPLLVICSGEALTAKARNQLQDFFGVPVYSFYSAGEVGCVGFECALQHGFHLENQRLWVEVDDHSGLGEIVVTTLENWAMPLVRYRTGDFSQRLFEQCACGDPRIRIGPIIGRSHDAYLAMLNQVTAI